MNSNKTLVHTNKFYSAFVYSLIKILKLNTNLVFGMLHKVHQYEWLIFKGLSL